MELLRSSFVSKSWQSHIMSKKAYLLFLMFKIGTWEQGWSQVTFLNTETPANQF